MDWVCETLCYINSTVELCEQVTYRDLSNYERVTIDPYRDCPADGAGWNAVPSLGAVSIGPFEVSRWRLRRTR